MKKTILIALLAIFATSVSAQKLVYGPVTSSEIILKQNPLTEISRYTTTTIYVGKTVTETIQFETVDLNNYFNPEEADWNATEISEEEERLLNEKGVVLCDTLVLGKKFVGWYRVTKDKKIEKNDLVDKPKSSNNKQNIYKI